MKFDGDVNVRIGSNWYGYDYVSCPAEIHGVWAIHPSIGRWNHMHAPEDKWQLSVTHVPSGAIACAVIGVEKARRAIEICTEFSDANPELYASSSPSDGDTADLVATLEGEGLRIKHIDFDEVMASSEDITSDDDGTNGGLGWRIQGVSGWYLTRSAAAAAVGMHMGDGSWDGSPLEIIPNED